MSTSFVYHAFGATTYRHFRTEYREGAIYFHLVKKDKHRRCVECGSRDVTFDGDVESEVKTLPIGQRPVFLVLHLKVLKCRRCGARRQDGRDVADPRKSYTRTLARYVLELAKHMTLLAVAKHLGVYWGMVKAILKSDLERKAKRRSWRRVRRIAIDEIAIRKGHNYMTVVLDIDTGQVLFAVEGRTKEGLKPFFRRLRCAGAKLEAVAIDMSTAYTGAIEEYGPEGVAVVHDHYHVVANMNAVIDKVRRDEQHRLEGEDKEVLKGARYLLLCGREKLVKDSGRKTRLDQLLAANETLHKVYLLKEDLRLWWSQESKEDARDFIEQWIDDAKELAIKPLTTFAKTVETRMEAILAWYDHPITSGPIEGTNNKIKVLKRNAYGYRDTYFFILRLLFLHETKITMAGT